MVVQKVDFVDVQQAPIGRSQNAGFKMALTFLNGFFDIQGSNNPVLCGRNGEVDKGRPAGFNRDILITFKALPAFGAPGDRFMWIAAKPASLDDLNGR